MKFHKKKIKIKVDVKEMKKIKTSKNN